MNEDELLQLLAQALDWAKPNLSYLSDGIGKETTLAELGLESITLLEMAAYFEDKLQIEIPDEELGKIHSIADFADLLERQTG